MTYVLQHEKRICPNKNREGYETPKLTISTQVGWGRYKWYQSHALAGSMGLLSTRCINIDRSCLLWLRYLYILILFFLVQKFYALFIIIWDLFFFFRLFMFVFILDEHPWHAINVFVRFPKCHFNSAIILQPKKLFCFTLVYLEISQVSFF